MLTPIPDGLLDVLRRPLSSSSTASFLYFHVIQSLQEGCPGTTSKSYWLTPLSDIRLAILPHGSFKMRSGYWNSAPLICALRIGKKHRNRGFRMYFEACERRILMHFVPLPRYCIVGAVGFEMSYLVDYLLFKWIGNNLSFQFQLFQLIFLMFQFRHTYI